MDLCSVVSNKNLRSLDISRSFLSELVWGALLTALSCDSCRLENCQLTEACCKEVSVTLVVSQRLTHLCLARNDLRDNGALCVVAVHILPSPC
uniref:Uncharacterized protein n=1 Tax=Marmota marmota marmota TaxID=9994 RepID=A0A8C5YI73_MARMA